MDGAARRQLRRCVRARRAELAELGRSAAYARLRDEVAAGAFGPVPPDEGWLYEDFHLAEKDAVFSAARSGRRIGADDIASASRLYTPRPIVDLILQNTLGAAWLAMHPDSPLRARWGLLVPEAIGPQVTPRALRDLRILDPCCGAGAFLLAALEMIRELAEDERRAARAGHAPHEWCLQADEVGGHAVGRMLVGADIDAAAVAIASRDLASAAAAPAARLRTVDGPLGCLDPGVWPDERFDVICTNPPWIGFRQLDPEVKRIVTGAVPLASSDLAVAVQARCQDLVSDGGRVGTVTPAAWLAGRPALALRRRILAEGGPVLVAQLGQGVFESAPLVFTAVTVVRRGSPMSQFAAIRGSAGPEAESLAAPIAARRTVATDIVRALPSVPFSADGPPQLLGLGVGPRRRIGDVTSTFDGVWTGDNRRDLRYWWELGHEAEGWVPLSGGVGYQPWVAPTRLRIPREQLAGQQARDGCLEYARVAGGRLGVRVAAPETAALAGVVTIVPESGAADLLAEILAVCNSRVGATWVSALTAGLNFNPGYLAQIPLGDRVDPILVKAVSDIVALRTQVVRCDPSHDGFRGADPRGRIDLELRLARATAELDSMVCAHFGLPESMLGDLAPLPSPRRHGRPEDDPYLEAAMRSVGFRWPADPPTQVVERSRADVVAAVHAAARDAGLPVGWMDPERWVRERLAGVARRIFRGRQPVDWIADRLVVARPD